MADFCDARDQTSWERLGACARTAARSRKWRVYPDGRWVSVPGGRSARGARQSAPDRDVGLRNQPLRGPNGRKPLPGRAFNSRLCLVPKASTPASFAGPGRRGVGGTGRLPNGRAGSESWPIIVTWGAGLAAGGPKGLGAVAWKEMGPSSSAD